MYLILCQYLSTEPRFISTTPRFISTTKNTHKNIIYSLIPFNHRKDATFFPTQNICRLVIKRLCNYYNFNRTDYNFKIKYFNEKRK